MELPTTVLVRRVLRNVNITNEKQQLVSTFYENMKKQLKAIYDSSSSNFYIKEEQLRVE